jgi:hypothetical protein
MLQPKLLNVEPLEDYKIKLQYQTGEVRVFDVLPHISGEWYEELHDAAYFQTVHVIPGGAGIAWAHGQDIAPHELYDAISHEDERKGAATGAANKSQSRGRRLASIRRIAEA